MRMRHLSAVTLSVTLAGIAGSARADGSSSLAPIQKRLLSGFASHVLDGEAGPQAGPAAGYTPRGSGGCSGNIGSNVKVNQNCLNVSDPDLQGRGQAQNETSIAADPSQPNHVVAAFNDYRRGDGTCGVAWSTDGGRNWNDATVGNGFTRGTAFGAAREYWQASGDPSVAWDTKGNAYLSCQTFKRGRPTTNDPDASSALYVYRSTGNGGASWNFPGRAVAEDHDITGATLLDKQLMTVDATVGSPFQDRIYVTWTFFAADGSAYIYAAHSSDYGETFSAPVLVSGDSALCTTTYGVPTTRGRCNENQYSQPFTGPDGALYVTYANFNNTPVGIDNRNQILLAKSIDGGVTFGSPVKVADYYDLPDCASYQQGQDPGRACVPEKADSAVSFFRASNYPVGAAHPTRPNQIAVTFGSYINPHSREANGCVPQGFSAFGTNLFTGVKTPGACNNDILVSVSNDAGQSFTGSTTDPRQLTSVAQGAATDQWFQWAVFSRNGSLVVAYYDRQYGDAELTGFSDVSVSSSASLVAFSTKRVTSSSMPPPTQFSGTFWGDYIGLSAVLNALPIWSDTRNPDLFLCRDSGGAVTLPPSVCTTTAPNAALANDQEIYTAIAGVQ